MEARFEYMALRILFLPSLVYEISFVTSLAKVEWLGAENNCVTQTDKQTDRHTDREILGKFIYRFIFET